MGAIDSESSLAHWPGRKNTGPASAIARDLWYYGVMSMANNSRSWVRWNDFGAYLRSRRQARGLSQQAMAELIGRKQPDVCNYEQGRSEPSVETLINIADALDIPRAELLAEIPNFCRRRPTEKIQAIA